MLVKGNFNVKWGNNPILQVSEVGFNYDVDTSDYDTIEGTRYTIEGVQTATIDITLLGSDIASLRTVLPQYYVAQGGTLSTGETVTSDVGAIDVDAASCDTSTVNYPLDITACGADAEVTRLVNARSRISSIDLQDNKVRTVKVTFIG